MTVDLERQVSEFWMETSAALPELDAEEIVLRALEGTDEVTLLPLVSGVHSRRGLLAAAVVTTVVAIGLIFLLLHPGDELAPVGTPDSVPREPAVTVPDSTSPEPAPRGDTVVPSSVPDPAVPSTVTDSLGNEWSRVPLDEAVFAGAEVWDVTAGGPGLVAVGFDPMGAAVWTSVDGLTWSRVPHDDAVFGEQSEETYMSDVTAGGPGLVAVGINPMGAAVWTSVDGLTWSRVPAELAPYFDDGPPSLTAGGPGLVAVGQARGDAAVWTSVDGLAWSRVPHDETVFGGRNEAGMTDVIVGGPGLVAVGADWVQGGGLDGDDGVGYAVVWTSADGLTWSRVPHDDAVFGGQPPWPAMTGVTVGGPGLVAVGLGRVWTSVDGLIWDYEESDWGAWIEVFSAGSSLVVIESGTGVWTSVDGITWSGVPNLSGAPKLCPDCHGHMTVGGPGLVAVVNTHRGVEVWLVTPEN